MATEQDKATGRLAQRVEDLLARVDGLQARLGLTSGDVERGAGIPVGWIAKARAGKGRGHRGAASVGRLASWVTAQGGEAARGLAPTASGAVPGKLGAELAAQIRKVKTFKACRLVERSIAAALVEGALDAKAGDLALSALKGWKASKKAGREEQSARAVHALEILTDEDREILRAGRLAKLPPPLKPGEAAPPPVEGPIA